MYYAQTALMQTPQACLVDLIPPTFAGVATVVPDQNGSLLASWLAASDPTLPITYKVYALAGNGITAAQLFVAANIVALTSDLFFSIYVDGFGVPLIDSNYAVGVRAFDGVGNIETNVVIVNASSEGVLNGDFAEAARDVLNASRSIKASLSIIAGGPVGKVLNNKVVHEIEGEN